MILCIALCCVLSDADASSDDTAVLLLEDNFAALKPGLFFDVVGAHTEYHYLSETAGQGNWAVTSYKSDQSQRAWRVITENGSNLMQQVSKNEPNSYTHPMLAAGDPLWENYTVTVQLAVDCEQGQSGLVFRYQNDRCYYFFGLEGPRAVLKMVRHETAFHKPYEKILAQGRCAYTPGRYMTASVNINGGHIRAQIDNGTLLEADDPTYKTGRIGLLADVPTRYRKVMVTTTRTQKEMLDQRIARRRQELEQIQARNPRPVPWKKIGTEGFGAGRNLRFGDLDQDGRIDVLIGQVIHHGPKDRNSELSCLTAMTFDGKILWQIGQPDPWKDHLTNDVGFQIHDLDGDGKNEVIYCMNMELIVADGATGKTLRKTRTPAMPEDEKPPYNRFPRILGDCLYFCDLRGTGRPSDLIIKTRYRNLWALNDQLEILWNVQCNTGHYPYAFDADGDGKDELAIGYSLIDDNGQFLWCLDKTLQDHADGVAIVRLRPDQEPRLLCAASDEGIFWADLKGNILKHHYLGHVQNPAVADFRSDLPGLETVAINFWGNQGIIHFFDADGNVYHDFEPCQHGSMCLPVNWTGSGEEYFVLSANVEEGGLFDGRGRRAVVFPGDGHPDLCYAVLDITGDCRDEIVVWDPYEIWVYTQSDNPKQGRLYRPVRNPLYNYSNYQATVSLPGWSQ